MNVEMALNKNKQPVYMVAHAQATVYSQEEPTVFVAIENLKQRVTELENRPSGGGFGGTINAQVMNTEVTVE